MSNQQPTLLPAVLTVKELADALQQPVTAVIGKLMAFGVLATINQDIDFDTAAIVADDFGMQVERKPVAAAVAAVTSRRVANNADLETRPPIVTIMGHVDHGKTTLLDTIRKSSVADKEAGGITQAISSYQVDVVSKEGGEPRTITFLDTPGHSAFEAMRRHGAQITDLVILVVAADDGIKPQTIEAIKHARSNRVPIMVAINKIDKPDADIEKVKAQLAEHDLVPEEWGGSTVIAPVSATKNIGIHELLELILLSTDLRDLKADFSSPAIGVVVESHVRPGVGPVATVLVQNGTLKVGDFMAIGGVSGRVRTLVDHRGKRIERATPATPTEVSGLSGIPQFGDMLAAFETERDAKESAKQHTRSATAKRATSVLSSSALGATQREGGKSVLNLIVKADTKGSLEAIRDTLSTMRNDDVEVRVVSDGVGDITEGDVTMAVTAKALIVGFTVRLPAAVKTQADRDKASVALFTVVYELFDSVRDVLADLMPMITIEQPVADLAVLARFRDNRKNIVAGGRVEEGTLVVNTKVKQLRGEKLLGTGKLVTLRRAKDIVKQVPAGSECGVEILFSEGGDDVAPQDVLHFYTEKQERKALGL